MAVSKILGFDLTNGNQGLLTPQNGVQLVSGATVEPLYGSSANTVAQGNDNRLGRILTSYSNAEISAISKGQAVRKNTTDNQVLLAQANSAANSDSLVGLVFDTSITASASGNIIAQGILSAIPENNVGSGAIAVGDVLYLSSVTAGFLTNVKPISPNKVIRIGVVKRRTVGVFPTDFDLEVDVDAVIETDAILNQTATVQIASYRISGPGTIEAAAPEFRLVETGQTSPNNAIRLRLDNEVAFLEFNKQTVSLFDDVNEMAKFDPASTLYGLASIRQTLITDNLSIKKSATGTNRIQIWDNGAIDANGLYAFEYFNTNDLALIYNTAAGRNFTSFNTAWQYSASFGTLLLPQSTRAANELIITGPISSNLIMLDPSASKTFKISNNGGNVIMQNTVDGNQYINLFSTKEVWIGDKTKGFASYTAGGVNKNASIISDTTFAGETSGFSVVHEVNGANGNAGANNIGVNLNLILNSTTAGTLKEGAKISTIATDAASATFASKLTCHISVGGALVEALTIENPADGEVALLVRRNVGGVFSVQRVSMGVADSGGTGFRVLRIAN